MQTHQAAVGGQSGRPQQRGGTPFATALADACPPDNILLDVPVESAIQLFDLVAHHVARDIGVSAERIRAELIKREQLGSTGLGQGVAIPHARVDGIGSAVALFVRARYPFTFNAPDRKPVREFVVLVLPHADDRAHLELLADAARWFSERAIRQASRDAQTPDEIRRLMQRTV
ncbi:PTS sugar transporter subunit IIA [Burkholderia cenocepacia]|jgi:PTS system nitrogen regulatory IIA component|uniref:PTS sugar transporter subunit IIA n=1 Tax=Burkholderia cenocepacia TaxID=95486 RepID=UPI0004F60EBE|nr:PTS sugar transporter subunit IIA [Burkholderia cenocepacia]AIO44221.1 phosphoenolpyruvate-dependent sugar phosphotransferase system, EIIA 2 family protein [Burkholderia cepacia]ELW9532420.1 PTS sugar transporter subunit IIA [Burkholderia cenocepacia]KGC00704.1 phosphoenolpyruvate-dependent sugar phosphotransferase system, EIIA 2 family protein [Burkholderia cepacia]MCG0577546.1 PTS sugar transporter subunit IIA [Burkholderia cenocepacia]MCW3521844.1 PTS sugar transporter subunit IIA [Burkh